MYSYKNCILVLFLVVVMSGFAQDTLNSEIVEQRSYQFYINKNWKELINFGNKAINNGIDYYYLRIRIGIAYFEKKNFSSAENHFKKTLNFNSDDELAKEYLYYCYLYNGKNEEARLLSKSFSTVLSEKIKTNKQSSIEFIMAEGGTKLSDSSKYYNKNLITRPYYFDAPVYLQLGLKHYIKNKFSVFHALTYYYQRATYDTVSQIQYYLKATIPIKQNILISPSIHYLMTAVTKEIVVNQTELANKHNTTHNLVGSLTIQKTIQKTVIGLGTTVSNINKITQYIHSGLLSYSIFGNSKLVLGCTGYVHTIDNYKTSYVALAPFVYIQPIKRLSLKLSLFTNPNVNIIEDNGYFVNNSPNITQSRYSTLLNFSLNKYVDVYGVYQLEFKHYPAFEKNPAFDYRYNVFVLGIKIKP